MFDAEDLSALINEAVPTIILYRIDAPSVTTYRFSYKEARDAVVAYALGDKLAFEAEVEVPTGWVRVKKDGRLRVKEPRP